MEYLIFGISVLIGVIGFFLVRLIGEHDSTKKKLEMLWTKQEVLSSTFELKHASLGQHMEKLSSSMEKLSEKIDTLTDTVVELKHR
jgi:hypothetical protein